MLKFPVMESRTQTWIFSGVPVLFFGGSLMHFVYECSGKLIIAGIFSPVNESIWEHLKMSFWPMLVWWTIGYYVIKTAKLFSAVNWISASAAALVICPLVILSFFYTYTGAFGIESLPLDIFSLFLGLFISQIFALHIYNYARLGKCCLFISFVIIIIIAVAFIVFTFHPPHIPLFMDPKTKAYGI